MQRQVAKAEAGVQQARRDRYPDVSVELEGRNYTGNGEFRQGMALMSINLPWFNSGKYRERIRKESAMKDMAEQELADYRLELRAEVHGLTLKIEAARREALLYRDEIVPRTETALASARSAWESGSGMFRDLLESRRMLLEARTMQTRATREQYIELADLVLCCGLGDMEALFMLQPVLSGESNPASATQPKP
jgi:outer membrane protein TolC